MSAGLHAFRHAKASTLLDRGARMEEVSAILGHADLSTTAKVYAKFDVANLRAAFDRYSAEPEEPAAGVAEAG